MFKKQGKTFNRKNDTVENGLKQRIDDLKRLVDQRMLQILDKPAPVSLYEPMRYSVSSGGKRIRPILLLLSAEAVGSRIENALDAAVALELVHNFTLVHDDIMDNDDWRRGRQTVHKKWDESTAILAGDGLLVKAYVALAQVNYPRLQEIVQHFSQSILQVCEGQALDKEFESRETVSMDEYFEMIDKKTARLFSAACEIGGMIGGGNQEQVNALATYGRALGRAFQVQDDLLDVTADQQVLGKDVGSDLEENKKTFLIVHFTQTANDDLLQQLQAIRDKKKLSKNDLDKILEIFQASGTIRAARTEVDKTLSVAEDALKKLPDSMARVHLQQVLMMLRDRNS